MSLQLYIALYPFFHKKYGQNLSIILFAFFFYLFYIPKIQYYIFIAVFYFTLYIFSRQEHFFISASNIKNAAEWIFVSVLRRFWYWKMKLVG